MSLEPENHEVKPDAETESSSGALWLLRGGVLAAVALAVLGAACGLIVSETESALVLRFGKPVRVIEAPGFYVRWPAPVERVVRVDKRLHHGDIRLSETLTRDQRNVIVPLFFTWRVIDPLQFHTAVGGVERAHAKLDALVTSARNSVLGKHDFSDLTGGGDDGREIPGLSELEKEMMALAAGDARGLLGIELVSAGITQIQLPEANTESVFRRMRAERTREAEQYRAEGRAEAAKMKAETDKEATRMIAEAKRMAEETRGKAEAEAASIYAAAHGKHPAFYRFLRELQSLRTVVDQNTTVILDTGVAPFQWLKVGEDGGDPVSSIVAPPPLPDAPETTGSGSLPDGGASAAVLESTFGTR